MKNDWVTSLEKIDYIRQNELYREVDIKEFLNIKGIRYYPASREWIKMQCLYPDHDDATPSFYINLDTYGYNCYGCHRHGNFFGLCRELGWDVDDGDNNLIGIVKPSQWKSFRDNIVSDEIVTMIRYKVPNGFTFISENDNKCGKHLKYCIDRGLNSAINEFKIGYSIKSDDRYGGAYINRIIIPVHNPIGKTVWFEGRRIDGIKKMKYWRPKGVSRDKIVFNIHRLLIKEFRWVIVVEGIIDAMLLWTWGYPAVCVFGAHISLDQSNQLMYFDDIYLCFDNDVAGRECYKESAKMFVGLGSNLYYVPMPIGNDAADLGMEKFSKRLQKARKIY